VRLSASSGAQHDLDRRAVLVVLESADRELAGTLPRRKPEDTE